MIEKLSLKNFKAFRELNNLEFKPITILCGKNSCGKSTIIQSILLFKQTIECQNPLTLFLNSRLIHLGLFEDIIYNKNPINKIEFKFDFNLPRSISRKRDFSFRRRESLPFQNYLRDLISKKDLEQYQDKIKLNVKLAVKIKEDTDIGFKISRAIVIDSLEIKFSDLNKGIVSFTGPYLYMNHIKKNKYNVKYYRIPRRSKETEIFTGEFDIKIQDFYKFIPRESKIIHYPKEKKNISITTFFRRIYNILELIFSKYELIGPLREEPSRRYIYEDEFTEIGVKGENAAYLYLNEQDKIIKNHYFYNEQEDSFVQIKKDLSLKESLILWLNSLNIHNFSIKSLKEIIYIYLNSHNAENLEINIADVGFGVSQIFPVLLEGLRMPIGNTLILEQPEIHLHPSLQAKMTDFFIALALSGKNFIIETHSEHIINRMTRRIVEDPTGYLNRIVNIVFIEPSLDGAKSQNIIIDDKNGIVNWPEGFMDQSFVDTQRILEASSKKYKKKEKNDNL